MASLKGKENPRYKTGLCMKRSGKSNGVYNSWQNMKGRCLRKTHPKYHRYGGRGIGICDEWISIIGFSQWAFSSGWKDGLTLDRIDNDGNYEPSNCWWVSPSFNSRKKSTTKVSFEIAQKIRKRALKGEDEHDLAEEFNVCHGTIWHITNNITHVSDMQCTKKLQSLGRLKY